MAVQYLDAFDNILYTFDESRQQFLVIKNIFDRVKLDADNLARSVVFYPYSVKDSDTAWSIASKYYGDPTLHWLVFLANLIIDPYYDWPLNTTDFNNALILKYGSLQTAQNTLNSIQYQETITTTIQGTSNTITYTGSITDTGLTYNFKTGQLQTQTLPTLSNPIINLGSNTVIFPDGHKVITSSQLMAISDYDYEMNINEAKRNIQLIGAAYAGTIKTQYAALFAQ